MAYLFEEEEPRPKARVKARETAQGKVADAASRVVEGEGYHCSEWPQE